MNVIRIGTEISVDERSKLLTVPELHYIRVQTPVRFISEVRNPRFQRDPPPSVFSAAAAVEKARGARRDASLGLTE